MKLRRPSLILFGWMAATCTGLMGQAPQSSGDNPVLFGNNADLQDATTTKSVELGVEQYEKTEKPKKRRRGEFAFAPIPMVNPSIGNGGGLAVLYAVHLGGEDSSPPTTFGIAAFATASGSWG